MKRELEGPASRERLPELLEGYFYGLDLACQQIFGPQAADALYVVIGRYFRNYLQDKMGIELSERTPWEIYCRLAEVFVQYGFYSHVELEDLGDGRYWMLESGQYASAVWEETGAFTDHNPPCPLWSVIVSCLRQSGYIIHLDEVALNHEVQGFESTFHFEPIEADVGELVDVARERIIRSMITVCAMCKRVRNPRGRWVAPDVYLGHECELDISHGYCPDCAASLEE